MSFVDPVLPRNRAHRQSRIAAQRELLPDDAVANILAIYSQASAEEIADGHDWYPFAGTAVAEEIAALGGITVRQACGIIAALSPQTSWDENIRLARAFVQGEEIGHIGNFIGKATSILHGVDPDKVLRGRKVRSFFANIYRPNVGGAVTVDRHAFSIILGRNADDREIKALERVGVYSVVAGYYRSAARTLGISPQVLQAITWLTWRRVKVYALPQHSSLYQSRYAEAF